MKLISGHSYQDFFTFWKDDEPDISILKQAKAERGCSDCLWKGRFLAGSAITRLPTILGE